MELGSLRRSAGQKKETKTEPYGARHVYIGRKKSGSRRQMGQAVPDKRQVVLVVEDEFLVRLIAMDMIQSAGFEAITAPDADEAIRILESRNDIRAVFTDVQMPGSMDGLCLARVIRDRWPPVALIVTSAQRNIMESDLPQGGRFIGKPYDPAQIET